jgi:hypothetical protein
VSFELDANAWKRRGGPGLHRALARARGTEVAINGTSGVVFPVETTASAGRAAAEEKMQRYSDEQPPEADPTQDSFCSACRQPSGKPVVVSAMSISVAV